MRANLEQFEQDFEKHLDAYFTAVRKGQSIDRLFILISTWLVRTLAVRNDDLELAKSHFKEARKWFDELGTRLFQ